MLDSIRLVGKDNQELQHLTRHGRTVDSVPYSTEGFFLFIVTLSTLASSYDVSGLLTYSIKHLQPGGVS